MKKEILKVPTKKLLIGSKKGIYSLETQIPSLRIMKKNKKKASKKRQTRI